MIDIWLIAEKVVHYTETGSLRLTDYRKELELKMLICSDSDSNLLKMYPRPAACHIGYKQMDEAALEVGRWLK